MQEVQRLDKSLRNRRIKHQERNRDDQTRQDELQGWNRVKPRILRKEMGGVWG